MKLIVQPEDGIAPLLAAVKRAKRSIDVVIFRFDLRELEKALEAAVARGVTVRALIACTNTGGEGRLRKLEQRMLEAGVTVARTDDDLTRYHGKLMIVDCSALYLLGFNYTSADIRSRSFGLVVKKRKVVQEVVRLFEADASRSDFNPHVNDLVVSPENARARLSAFIQKAKRSLDIYDPQVTDDAMIRLLKHRVAQGVKVRIIGKLEKKWRGPEFDARSFPGKRLHVRAIIRDGRRVFIGSQSLRKLELDERREVGLFVRDRAVVKRVQKIFERDWKQTRGYQSDTRVAA
jgi:phosphatidylserine/phosphatidylglycerophosphate/cardiolipin synthase-like enzyme